MIYKIAFHYSNFDGTNAFPFNGDIGLVRNYLLGF